MRLNCLAVLTPDVQRVHGVNAARARRAFRCVTVHSLGPTAGTISGEEVPIVSKTNIKEYRDSFSCEKFTFRSNPNITFYVYVSNFSWPIKIQVRLFVLPRWPRWRSRDHIFVCFILPGLVWSPLFQNKLDGLVKRCSCRKCIFSNKAKQISSTISFCRSFCLHFLYLSRPISFTRQIAGP